MEETKVEALGFQEMDLERRNEMILSITCTK
jgi:hypothetical protein